MDWPRSPLAGNSVEAANPRHAYEWRVWEDVKLPEGKVLIPGVIAHTTAVVEHPETVAERLMNFARVVGRERVILSKIPYLWAKETLLRDVAGKRGRSAHPNPRNV